MMLCCFSKFNVGVGDSLSCGLKGFRNLGKKMYGTVSINPSLKQSALSLGLNASRLKVIVFVGYPLISTVSFLGDLLSLCLTFTFRSIFLYLRK